MIKHTQGPWMLNLEENQGWADIIAVNEQDEKYPTAVMTTHRLNDQQGRANAALIVAAPCLLAELEKAHILLAIALATLNPAQTQKVCALSKLWTESDSTRSIEREEVIRRAKGENLITKAESITCPTDSQEHHEEPTL